MFLDVNSGIVFDSENNKRAEKRHHKEIIQDYIIKQVSEGAALTDIPILGCEDVPPINEIFDWSLNDAKFAKDFQTAEHKRCRLLNERYHSELQKYINNPDKERQDVVASLKNIIEHQRKVLASQEAQVTIHVTQLFDAFGDSDES